MAAHRSVEATGWQSYQPRAAPHMTVWAVVATSKSPGTNLRAAWPMDCTLCGQRWNTAARLIAQCSCSRTAAAAAHCWNRRPAVVAATGGEARRCRALLQCRSRVAGVCSALLTGGWAGPFGHPPRFPHPLCIISKLCGQCIAVCSRTPAPSLPLLFPATALPCFCPSTNSTVV